MLKYRGTYRVINEIDKSGKVCEFTYIPCLIKRGSNIYRYNDTTLSLYIPSTKIVNRLLQDYPTLFRKFLMGDCEGVVLFDEINIGEVAVIVKAKTQGKNISPRAKRNKSFVEKIGVLTRKTM